MLSIKRVVISVFLFSSTFLEGKSDCIAEASFRVVPEIIVSNFQNANYLLLKLKGDSRCALRFRATYLSRDTPILKRIQSWIGDIAEGKEFKIRKKKLLQKTWLQLKEFRLIYL